MEKQQPRWRKFWPFKKKKKKKKKSLLRSWLDAFVFAAVAAFFIRTFLLEAFFIPTSSMERSLLVGDLLFVSKVNYGARLPMSPLALPIVHNSIPLIGVKSFIPGVELPYVRLWGLEDIERNTPVVFNYPAHDIDDRIGNVGTIDIPSLKENYIKRCVGIPGDVLEIKDAQLYINGKEAENPEEMQMRYILYMKPNSRLQDETSKEQLEELGFREPIPHTASWLGYYKADQNTNIYWVAADNQPKVRLGQDPETNKDLIFPEDKVAVDSLGRPMWYIFMPANMVEKVKKVRNVDEVRLAKMDLNADYGVKAPNFVLGNEHAYQSKLNSSASSKFDGSTFPTYQLGKTRVPQAKYGNVAKYMTWDMDNMGPITIPKEGMTIKLTLENLPLYERAIAEYEDHKLEVKGTTILIDDKPATSYTFEMDYYWMMGDNRYNSEDSRFWGYVPADHIVGKPLFIIISLEGGVRWGRIFKGID